MSKRERDSEDVHWLCWQAAQRGLDANSAAGMAVRASIWQTTKRKPAEAAFQTALGAIHEFHRIAENHIGLWHDGREVWPNDADYITAQAEAMQKQRETVNEHINALLGDNTP